jgi:hypothetical protein
LQNIHSIRACPADHSAETPSKQLSSTITACHW